MSFIGLSEMESAALRECKPLWRIVMEEHCRESHALETDAFRTMQDMFRAMKTADACYDPSLRSASGMVGGDGEKLSNYRQQGNSLLGDYLAQVVEKAVKMAESNACMRRIVAAPTAGSCGIIPAVLLTYQAYRQTEEQCMVEALFVAAGIGEVLAANASISGAEGGCQAEIGSACAMAAGAVTFLEGGSTAAVMHASALALKSMLGLTCDPVAGLVEVPCVKRNAAGAANAVVVAHMALAGVRSVIPPDEVIQAMRRIGKIMPVCLRETSQEGLATTPTGLQIAHQLSGS